jgi:membrane associated rhomboid family serine protease
MGFQDRDYYRESSQSIYVTSMVIKLMIINGIVFLAEILFGNDLRGNSVASLLSVHADTIARPWYWWQFLTAGFVHDPQSITHIFFNMFSLYIFGMRLEEQYGRKEFLRFYLTAIVLGFVVWSASNYFLLMRQLPANEAAELARLRECYGASGGVTAAIVLFCLLHPRATLFANFIFPVPAWVIGILTVAGDLHGSISKSALTGGVAYDVHLVGAALALGYWYFGWNFGQLPGADGYRQLVRSVRRWGKPKPPLRVHDPEHYYEDLDAQADRLLQKVHDHGQESLTVQERRILEDYSRRTRQKLR